LRYLVVGMINTGISFGAYAGGIAFGLPVALASLCAIVLGVLVSFAGQGALVFGDRSPAAFIRFVVSWGLMYMLHVGVVTGLGTLGLNAYLGGIVALVVTTSISYFVLRDFVFRAAGRRAATRQT
jgi:putative flippase GtrA